MWQDLRHMCTHQYSGERWKGVIRIGYFMCENEISLLIILLTFDLMIHTSFLLPRMETGCEKIQTLLKELNSLPNSIFQLITLLQRNFLGFFEAGNN